MSQDELVGALASPDFYPHRPRMVEHVQTHISHVFLAGPYVYKLKKAVHFPFLDFSTAELRRHFCLEEVRLNRRLSPGVYLDVLPIVRTAGGRLGLGNGGDVLDHVVWMRRLPAAGLLVNRLGRTRPEMMDELAAVIARFHASAPTGPEVAAHADADALRARWAANLETAAPFAGRLLAVEDHELLRDFGPSFVRRHETLLRARQRGGRIREGHGDLHAEHVCFLDAPLTEPTELPPLPAGIYVFDCIEFSRAFRCNDVASEVAFLAMDLESLERPDLARRFVGAYTRAADDPALEVLLGFYACYRACVRGKVESLASAEPEVEAGAREAAAARARRHFALAVRYAWQAAGPAVIACAGLAGTGKSTLARELAATTGFVLLATDELRRRGSAASAPAPYGAGLYTAAARAATYETLALEAEAALAAGHGVVADATFMRAADRRRLGAAAQRERRPYVFVECRAPETIVHARLLRRETERPVSDARWNTYLEQRERWEPFGADEPHVVVDTGRDFAQARATACRLLWRWRQGRGIEAA